MAQDSKVNSRNSALIYPEVFFDVNRVLEGDFPVGPSFVNSLSTLVEAVVIHNHLFMHSIYEHSPDTPWPDFYASDLSKVLKREGILVEPSVEEFDTRLSEVGSDYDYIDFVTDSSWTASSFLQASAENEASVYRAWGEIATQAPEVFSLETVVDDAGTANMSLVDPKALPLVAHGFTVPDLIHIEGFNRAMRGYQELSRRLGLNLYTLFQCVPHQVGAIRSVNSKTRILFEELQAKSLTILDTEEAVGDNSFQRIDIPPLCQIVLDKCKGSLSAFFDELLALRERHRKLRVYLTSYEEAWEAATTKEDARRLKAELAQAFENLAKLEASPTTRWIYRIWDVVKSPPKLLEKLGDNLASKGKQYYAVDRVWGLHDFYKDLRDSPLQKRNYVLLESLFERFAPEETWSAATDLAAAVETRVLSRPLTPKLPGT